MFPKSIPVIQNDDSVADRLKRVRELALKNLHISNLYSESFTEDMQDVWLQLFRLDQFFWQKAVELDSSECTQSELFIKKLRENLSRYEKLCALAKTRAAENPHMMVKVLYSYEVLAVWICFCWADRVAHEKFSAYRAFPPALDPSNLVHLVLRDLQARHALECLQKYLHQQIRQQHLLEAQLRLRYVCSISMQVCAHKYIILCICKYICVLEWRM